MGYSICKTLKFNNRGNLTVAFHHNYRTVESESFRHVNEARSYMNHDLVNTAGIEYGELIENRFRQVERITGIYPKKRKDAVIAIQVVLSFSHGSEEELGFTVEAWEEEALNWLKDYFGEENVLSAMVHLDEQTPHMHAIITPITQDLRLCARDFTGGAKKLIALDNSYGKAMKEAFGLELPLQNRKKPTWKTMDYFYKQIAAVEEITFPQKGVNEPEPVYRERLLKYVKDRELLSVKKEKKLEDMIGTVKRELFLVRKKYLKAIDLYEYLESKLYDKAEINAELQRLYQLEQMKEFKSEILLKQCMEKQTIPEYSFLKTNSVEGTKNKIE